MTTATRDSFGVRFRRRLRTVSRRTFYIVAAIVVLLVALRIALPYIVRDYVNRRLNELNGYRGSVRDIDMHLYRGAYQIRDIRIDKATGEVPVPFFSAPLIDLSVEWRQLFHGKLVGEVLLDQPEVNFVAAPTEEQSQKKVDKSWQRTLEKLFPFKINRFEIRHGNVRFRDFHQKPQVDVFVDKLSAMATNLSNARETGRKLPADVVAAGETIGGGGLSLHVALNPLADAPTFKVECAVSNVNLVAMNDFLRAYGKFDVKHGIFSVYSEVAAADGRYEGYVKPLFEDLDVWDWEKEHSKSILEVFWQAIVSATTTVFKNQPYDRLATRVPISGNFEKTQTDTLAAIGGILRNAFIRVLLPRIDRTVTIEEVEQKAHGDKSGSADSPR